MQLSPNHSPQGTVPLLTDFFKKNSKKENRKGEENRKKDNENRKEQEKKNEKDNGGICHSSVQCLLRSFFGCADCEVSRILL